MHRNDDTGADMTDGTFPLPWFRLPGPASPGADAPRPGTAETGAAAPGESAAYPGLEDLVRQANDAANFLKALGHDGRLLILCHLLDGPKSVTALENLLSARQAVVSQQLARLRLEGLVSARREGQAIFYSIQDPKVTEVLAVLAKLFCKPEQAAD